MKTRYRFGFLNYLSKIITYNTIIHLNSLTRFMFFVKKKWRFYSWKIPISWKIPLMALQLRSKKFSTKPASKKDFYSKHLFEFLSALYMIVHVYKDIDKEWVLQGNGEVKYSSLNIFTMIIVSLLTQFLFLSDFQISYRWW